MPCAAIAVPLLVRVEVGGQRLLERGLLALEPLWGHSPQVISLYRKKCKNDWYSAWLFFIENFPQRILILFTGGVLRGVSPQDFPNSNIKTLKPSLCEVSTREMDFAKT